MACRKMNEDFAYARNTESGCKWTGVSVLSITTQNTKIKNTAGVFCTWKGMTAHEAHTGPVLKSYTRFQCYVHRRHLRSSFDMPSFDMLFKRLFDC